MQENKRQWLDARFLPEPIVDLIAQCTGNVADASSWFTATFTPAGPELLARCIEASLLLLADATATADGVIDPAGRVVDSWLAPLSARRLRGGGLAIVRCLVRSMVAADRHPQSQPKAALLRRALTTSLLAQYALRHGAAPPTADAVPPPAHPTLQAWLNGQFLGVTEAGACIQWAVGVGATVATAVLIRVMARDERAHLVPYSVAPQAERRLGRVTSWPQQEVVQFWLERILLDEQGPSRAAAALTAARKYDATVSGGEPDFRRLLDVLAFYLELTKEEDLGACLAAPAVARFGHETTVLGLLRALATAVVLFGTGSPQATRLAHAGWQLVKRYGIPPHTLIKVGVGQCGAPDVFCAFALADPAYLHDLVSGVLEFIASPSNRWPAHSAEAAHRMLPRAVWMAVWNATGDQAALELGCPGALGALLVGGGLAIHQDVADIFDKNQRVLHPSAVVDLYEVGVLMAVEEADRHKDVEARRIASVQQVLALIATRVVQLGHDFLCACVNRRDAYVPKLQQAIRDLPGHVAGDLITRCLQWYVAGTDPRTDWAALTVATALMKFNTKAWAMPSADLLTTAALVTCRRPALECDGRASEPSFLVVLLRAHVPKRILHTMATTRLRVQKVLAAALDPADGQGGGAPRWQSVVRPLLKMTPQGLTPTSSYLRGLAGPSLLTRAIRHGDTEFVKELLNAGFDAHQDDGLPLVTACCVDARIRDDGLCIVRLKAMVRALVLKGAKPDWRCCSPHHGAAPMTAREALANHTSKASHRAILLAELGGKA